MLESDASFSDNDQTITTQSQTTTSKKRKALKKADPIWLHAREPIEGVEPLRSSREQGCRKIWYCKYDRCSQYSVLSTMGARHHLKTVHNVIVDRLESSKAQKIRQKDLHEVFDEQTRRSDENKNQIIQQGLREAANPTLVHQALLRLVVHHDLPLNIVEWPELHTLVHTINHQASRCVWRSHSAVAKHIHTTFDTRSCS